MTDVYKTRKLIWETEALERDLLCAREEFSTLRAELARAHAAHAEQVDEEAKLRVRVNSLMGALSAAEAALADIGDAEREEGDDLAWCERRAADELPGIRAVLKASRDVG